MKTVRPNGKVHPAAELFPSFAADELKELIADIKAHGLQQPIVLLPNGTLLEGRNRLAACRKARVKPSYVVYDGDAPWDFVISANVHRRHLSSGQRAMSLAIFLVETGQRENGRFRPGALKTVLSGDRQKAVPDKVTKAGFVLDHAPDRADAVMAGALALDAAYRQTRDAVDEAARGAERLAALRLLDPDLAERVAEETLSLDEAEREAQAARRLAALPPDLATRVTNGNLTLEEADALVVERTKRVAVWVEKVEFALDELRRLAGGPVPDELTQQLSERARRLLPPLLRVIERKEQR